MKRLRFCCAALTLALGVLLFSAASAERVTDLWATGLSGSFTPLSTASGDAVDTVHWWKNENNGSYHLFLPGTADLTQARLCFAGGETLTDESGAVIENGGPLSALPLEQPVRLTCGKQTFTLTVWQGSADMPAMYLTTASGSLDFIHKRKTNEETGTLLAKTADGETLYEGELKQIRGRGNASFQFYKKGYQIKLAESTSLYGMSKDRTWELLADYRDNSLLRNSLTLAMADAAGIPYVMDCLHVHLYINGEYMGVYLLSEKVEVDGGRVEIDELEEETEALNDQPLESYDRVGTRKYTKGTFKAKDIPSDPADLTGGYLLMLEYRQRYNGEPSGVVTKRGQAVVIKSPKYASEAQARYVQSAVQSFENAIFASDGVDSVTGKHYSELADMDSVVKKYILEELVKNYDANSSSQYMALKRGDGKLYFCSPWDYDSAYGNFGASKTSGWLKPTGIAIGKNQAESYYWLPALYKHEGFRTQVAEVFSSVYLPILRTVLGEGEASGEGLQSLTQYEKELTQDAKLNFTRWPTFNIKARVAQTGADYHENIEYLRDFLSRRIDFLCQEWGVTR